MSGRFKVGDLVWAKLKYGTILRGTITAVLYTLEGHDIKFEITLDDTKKTEPFFYFDLYKRPSEENNLKIDLEVQLEQLEISLNKLREGK